MSSVIESVEVRAPVSTVYNQWTQFESFPEFMGGVEQITQTDNTHTHWVTKIGGVRREFDTEITEQRPDERVAWKSTDGTTHAGVVTFHRLDALTTRVTAQIEWKPEGMLEKAGSMVGVDDRQVKADLDRFKHFIEDRGGETGAWRGEVEPGGQVSHGDAGTTQYGTGSSQYGTGSTQYGDVQYGDQGLQRDTGMPATGGRPLPSDMPSTAPGWSGPATGTTGYDTGMPNTETGTPPQERDYPHSDR